MRQQIYLRQRYRTLLNYIGQLVVVIGILHLVPLFLLPFYPEERDFADGFLIVGAPLIILGALAWRVSSDKQLALNLSVQEGAVIVVIIWLVATISAAVPFMITIDLNFTQAVFESTSGWTTTGLSVVDLTAAPKLLLFYRSFIQLAGGAGFAIIVLSAIAGSFGTGLLAAEGRTEQLAPHVRNSAAIVLRIYGTYIVLGVLALQIAGMDWFNAVNHAFTALATGGFSTRPESIAYWDSAAIEGIICVLMLLGSVNFLTTYTFIQGKYDAVRRNGELRLAIVVISISAVMLFAVVTVAAYPQAKALRVALFETISALTGTGFSSVTDYHIWNDFGWLLLVILMCIGGGTGSTSGGIKQFRIYILYKAIIWEIRRAFMPRHMVNEPAIWQGDKRELLSDKQVRQVALFVATYIIILLLGSGIMMIYGYPFNESIFEFASSLGTVGLSVGITRPDMPPLLLWLQTAGMFLGRLEVFVVIIGSLKIVRDLGIILRQNRSQVIHH